MSGIGGFLRGFRHAARGVGLAARDRNFRVMLAGAVAVVTVGFAYDVSSGSWAVLLVCIGAVLGAESGNSAIERLADRVQPEPDPAIRDVKDIAAGAVLVVSVAAAVVGVVVLWPYVVG
jgi:diacylglycerol kinase